MKENYNERMLKVLVDTSEGENINITIPVKVIISMLKVTGKFPIKAEYIEGVDVEMLSIAIIGALENETLGKIITVSSSKGDKIKVIVE